MKRWLLLLLLTGCMDSSYVEADAATYRAVAPVYSSYTAQDVALSPEDKARRYRLLRSWRGRIEAAR